MARTLTRGTKVITDAIRACTVLFAALVSWCACGPSDAIAWPNRDSYSPVATMRHEYSDPSKRMQAVRAIEQVVTENNFVLNHPPSRIGPIELNFLRSLDGVEILVTSIGEPNVLQVYVYDRLRKETWQEMKDKVEAAMNGFR